MVPAVTAAEPSARTVPVGPHASVYQPGPRAPLSPRHWLDFRKRETHDLKGSVPTCQASSAWSHLPLKPIWENLQLLFIYYTEWPKESEFPQVSPLVTLTISKSETCAPDQMDAEPARRRAPAQVSRPRPARGRGRGGAWAGRGFPWERRKGFCPTS